MNEELRNNVGKHPLILAIISAFCILHSAFASVYNGVYADTNNAILPGYTFNAANLTGNVSSNQLPTNLLYTVTLSAATNTLMTNVTAQIAAATNSVATNTAALLTAATNAVATNLIARLSAATNTVATNVTAQILTATNTIATNTAALLTAATNSVTTNTAAQISLATNSVTTNLTAILAGKTNPVFSGTVTIGGVTRTSWPTGAGVTTNASDLTTGTLDAGRLPAAAVTNNGAATLATLTLDSVTRSTWPAAIDPTTNAAALTTGTLDDARLSAHVVTNTAGVGLTVENDGLRIVGANGNPMALHHLNPNWLVSWDVNTTGANILT
ncbi:MAG: hypothetical protein NTZ16_12705 [Verrucomicrobia bacterium]|nr:hypothetical protein [Verrucomicrobiota bacterium]